MAEAAPITSAYAHARKAAEQTEHVHWQEAADEHQNAATDFARAARGTSDAEALRILGLLEEQHKKVADIIRGQDVAQSSEPGLVQENKKSKPLASTIDNTTSTPTRDEVASAKPRSTTSALAAARFSTSRARDSSPSLAREIASRRGIPQPATSHLSPAAQARARQLSPESQRRAKRTAAPKIPKSVMDSQASIKQPSRHAKPEDDEGFASFYNSVTSGTMSKLSSVLAYAGLPLTADDIRREPAPKPKSEKATISASNDPDVKKIFSKAALHAIEDEHRKRGTAGHIFGPAESFYVVQTGGGTYSYADIAKAQQQHLSGIGEDDEEAFVDAKEAQAPASPRHSRTSSHSQRGSFGKPRTKEELELENTTLKTTLEQLASRLANFEVHAQDASMAALTQSMVSLRPQGGDRSASDQATQERLEALEQQIEQQAEQREKLEELARKQEKKIRMYHTKWEEIRKSAKEKERVKREKADAEGKEGDESVAEGA